ncbi:hypothetical protein HU200_048614 [Digitaria exilis]|uniref:F-box domain-containing protein n=1 Tax=Digitaria exilis TaxID=1010633 RepID=A0A835B0F0_9POAL|nr:hypothetical protein HU200_048614 [Digitaria exilis]
MEMCWRSGNMLFRGLSNKILASSACSLMMKALFRRDGFLHRSISTASSEGLRLPQVIMMQIFSLLEIPDLVRAGSVCALWRTAYTSLCAAVHCKLQQTPCLLYTCESIGYRAMGLYSLAEKKAYTLTVPDPPIRSREVIGSSYGWIITADERSELQLLNPITGDQIALPSVTTIEQVEPIYDDAGTLCKYEYSRYGADWISDTPPEILDLSALRDYLFYKAFLSSDPSTGDYFVVLVHLPEFQLSFAMAGDVEWTWLPPHTLYEDCQFQGSLLYATTSLGEIHMYDLGARAVARKIVLDKVKPSVSERIYIVQDPSGELLQIKRSDVRSEDEYKYLSVSELCKLPKKTTGIKVHKVDLTSENVQEGGVFQKEEIQFWAVLMEMCWRSGSRTMCNLLFGGLANKILASSTCSLIMKALFRRDGYLHRSITAAAPVAVSEAPCLPQDIMMEIFSLLEIPDLVRAGSVCSSWRAAYTSLCATAHSKLQQTPCLLYTSESIGDRAMGLYSLAEKKAYTLTIPDPPIRSREVIGSSYGWIITADERSELQLLNPITGDQIALPSVTTIEQVEPIYDDADTLCQYEYSRYSAGCIVGTTVILDLSELRDYLFYKAFLSSDPSTGDYFVVLIHLPRFQLSFARAGDVEWTWLPPHTLYQDCQFQGSLLYATTSLGEIHMHDLGAPALARKIVLDKVKSSVSERIYIVQAPSGELLQIKRSADEGEYDSTLELSKVPKNTTSIKVHKVDHTSEKNLVEVDTLYENVLFIGLNQSLCLCAKEYPQLLPNHVYLTDDDYLDVSYYKDRRRDIGEFDLESNSIKEIVSPQLWSNSPTPVWLVPNPRRMNRLASHSYISTDISQ